IYIDSNLLSFRKKREIMHPIDEIINALTKNGSKILLERKINTLTYPTIVRIFTESKAVTTPIALKPSFKKP
ncbi:MAG: hypothetical protein Q8932_19395, partial [Bacteroidota bacterium]|nr:hypothetical protein [Bacteroidota bacterium]